MHTSEQALRPQPRSIGAAALLCALLSATEVAAQASSVGSATARRLLPAVPTVSEIQTVVRSTATALPAGYAERSFSVSAGPITSYLFTELVMQWGYQLVTCWVDIPSRVYTCADGVNPAAFYSNLGVAQNPCSGVRWDKVYQVTVYPWTRWPSTPPVSYIENFTCSAAKTYSTLYRVTTQ